MKPNKNELKRALSQPQLLPTKVDIPKLNIPSTKNINKYSKDE